MPRDGMERGVYACDSFTQVAVFRCTQGNDMVNGSHIDSHTACQAHV